jgi:hypothetical protein
LNRPATTIWNKFLSVCGRLIEAARSGRGCPPRHIVGMERPRSHAGVMSITVDAQTLPHPCPWVARLAVQFACRLIRAPLNGNWPNRNCLPELCRKWEAAMSYPMNQNLVSVETLMAAIARSPIVVAPPPTLLPAGFEEVDLAILAWLAGEAQRMRRATLM